MMQYEIYKIILIGLNVLRIFEMLGSKPPRSGLVQ
jgi:hypothetical protein